MNYSKFSKMRALVFFAAWGFMAFAACMYLGHRSGLALREDLLGTSLGWALGLFAVSFLFNRVYFSGQLLDSAVDGFGGVCLPTWLNVNQVCIRVDGGVTGFFKLCKKVPGLPLYFRAGKEFHGRIVNGKVFTTALDDRIGGFLRDALNVEGTLTGRFSAAGLNESNVPKSA